MMDRTIFLQRDHRGFPIFYHASLDEVVHFSPRVPESRIPGENGQMKRICVADNEATAICDIPAIGKAVRNLEKYRIPYVVHVYELIIDERDVMWNDEVQKYVPDANKTGEIWLIRNPIDVHRKDYRIIEPEIMDDGQLASFEMEPTEDREDNWKLLMFSQGIQEIRHIPFGVPAYRTFAQHLEEFEPYLKGTTT